MATTHHLCCCWPTNGMLGIYNNETDNIWPEGKHSVDQNSYTWIYDSCAEIQTWNPLTFFFGPCVQSIENTNQDNPFDATFATGYGADKLEAFESIIIPRMENHWGGGLPPDVPKIPFCGLWPCEITALLSWLAGGPNGISGRRLILNSDYFGEVHIGNMAQILELAWERELIAQLGGHTQIGSSFEHVSLDAWGAQCYPVSSKSIRKAFLPPVLNHLVAGTTLFHDSQPAMDLHGPLHEGYYDITDSVWPITYIRELYDYDFYCPWITFEPIQRGYLICILDWYFWEFPWGEATCSPPIDHAAFIHACCGNSWFTYGD